MSEKICVCERCYDPYIMRWEEYTGGLAGPCIFCGEPEAEHWFCSPKHIIVKLVRAIQALRRTA